MSGVQLLIVIVMTAWLSSLCTLVVGVVVFQRWIRPRLEARLEAFAELLEARVKTGAAAAGQDLMAPLRGQVRGGLEDAAVELLPRVRAELTAGFREAATESLPAFRDEVRKGFGDALNAGELLDRTAKKVVRASSSLVENGLNLLRATRPDNRHDDAPSA